MHTSWNKRRCQLLPSSTTTLGIRRNTEIVTRTPPMPTLDYVQQNPRSVSVTYTDMPAGAKVVFVNQVSGQQYSRARQRTEQRGQRFDRDFEFGRIERRILLAGTKFRSVHRPNGHVLHQLIRRRRDRPLRSFGSRGPLKHCGPWQESAPDRCSNDLFVARARAPPLCCRREFAMFGIGQHCCPNW